MKRKWIMFFFIFIIILVVIVTTLVLNFSNSKSLLIGTWVSDWRPLVDLNMYIFNKNGTAKELVITNENIEISQDITCLESKAEYVLNYKYKDYGDYLLLIPENSNEDEEIRINYNIEEDELKLEFDKAGYTNRSYKKLKK